MTTTNHPTSDWQIIGLAAADALAPGLPVEGGEILPQKGPRRWPWRRGITTNDSDGDITYELRMANDSVPLDITY